MGAMSKRRGAYIGILLASLIGSFALTAALPDVIMWDPIRHVWVDVKTQGVVTVTSNSVTNPQAGTTAVAAAPGNIVSNLVGAAAGPGFTQQGETRPQKWSDKMTFPLIVPDAEFFKTCYKNSSDILTMMTTRCDVFKDIVNCQQLAEMGYLPQGVQSFVPGGNLNGGYTLPNGCSSGNLGIEYDGLKMVFNSPQIPILAVIAKDVPLSKVFYFGSGVTQGRLMKLIMLKAEFCYAPPSISPLYVSKTAQYSTGMQPGTAAWNFFQTVALAPPFSNNVASMFRGDSADATWTVSVQKTGTDTVYQGAVNGQITITNPQNVPVTVYNINDYIQGGPQATVSCGTPVPFQIQPCSSTVCNYVAYWPQAPAAGSYTNLADVQYSVGSTGIMGNQVGTAIFQVTPLPDSVGMINTAVGAIPSGQAVVQDGMAPQAYMFAGTSQQSYTTQLTCPDTAIMTNQAVLTASTGQQITQTATVQKLCFELQVRIAQVAAPYVGKWDWTVSKIASTNNITLKPAQTAWDRYVQQQQSLAVAAGQDATSAMTQITGGQNFTALSSAGLPGTTNEEVTYTVTFTRTPPAGVVAGTPAFQTTGDVFITNSSPLNAQLKEVQVTISNPFGGLPYITTASCPILTVAAGQTLQCRYIATPSFNPVGASVSAAAIYLNNRNGVPTGATTAFTSASVMVAGSSGNGAAAGAGAAAAGARKLQAATSGNSSSSSGPASFASRISKLFDGQGSSSLTISNLPPLPPLPSIPSLGNSNSSSSGGGGFNFNKFVTDIAKNLADDSGSTSSTVVRKSVKASDVATVETVSADDSASTAVAAAAAPAAASPAPNLPQRPVVAAAPAPTTFDYQGLQQECVEVKDVFATGDDYVTGLLTSGTFPTGRICTTTSFTYTVRYGPFNNCFSKQAVNKASWYAADTQRGGDASSTVDITVDGCGAAVAAKARSYAVWAKKSYRWEVQKRVSPTLVTVGPRQPAKATYTIDYIRTEILVNPKLSTTLQFDSLSGTGVTLSGFTYSVTSVCDGQQRQKTGTFKCAAATIPAGGTPMSCQIQTDLPCVGPGVIVAQAKAKDKTVTSIPFNFPAPKSIDSLADSECAIVVDEFSSGSGLVTGTVASGVRPYGKLCGTKQFTYTATFGPFETCGRRKAVNKATLKTGSPTNASEADATLSIEVKGCSIYTPNPGSEPEPIVIEAPTVQANGSSNMRVSKPSGTKKQTSLAAGRGGSTTNCVSSVGFWKNCIFSANLAGRCAAVLKLPSGPQTAFFPSPNSRVVRTYKAVMTKGTNSGVKATDQWFKAAQAVVATQLNELAGVKLPPQVKEAQSLAGAAVSVSVTAPPVLTTELQGVPNAVALLEKFVNGQGGVPNC